MAEPVDTAHDGTAPPNVQPISNPEETASKPAAAIAESNASWTAVLSAMQLAEQAVSDAVQGMADTRDPSATYDQK
ncbi:hypothetical protein AB7M17_001532 [Bradyrhizobium sp. USDA 377]